MRVIDHRTRYRVARRGQAQLAVSSSPRSAVRARALNCKRGRMDGSRARRGGGEGREETPRGAVGVQSERGPPRADPSSIVVTIIFADDPTRRLALYLALLSTLCLSLAPPCYSVARALSHVQRTQPGYP